MFFNKSKFIASKLIDNIEIKPTVAFSIPVFIIDAITYFSASTIVATLVKTVGRDYVTLPTVLTISTTEFTSEISGTIASVDWDGIVPLNLKLVVDGSVVLVPLVVKA